MRFSERHRVFWFSAIIAAFFSLSYLIVPPLISLSGFRTYFASSLSNVVGSTVSIDGKIKLSLLGHPMISADNVRYQGVTIDSVRFRISWGSIFNLANAKITSAVKVSGLDMDVKQLGIPNFGKRIFISDSRIKFMDKTYTIVDGVLDKGELSGQIRTDEHKYNIDIKGGDFVISNPNEDLLFHGKLASDENGIMSATGTMSFETKDVNKWFDFSYPKISGKTKLKMDFSWDGKGLYEFSNINGTSETGSFKGDVKVWVEHGKQVHKSVQMIVTNANVNLMFLKDFPSFMYNSDFDITIDGKIKTPVIGAENLKHFSIKMSSNSDHEMDFDDLKVSNDKMASDVSGKIINGVARDLDVSIYQVNPEQSVRCKVSGTKKEWACSQWSIANKNMTAVGALVVTDSGFKMSFNSENAKPSIAMFDGLKKYLGDRNGEIDFHIGDMNGQAQIIDGKRKVDYVERGVALKELPIRLFLPKQLMDTTGNIAAQIIDDNMSFVFESDDFSFSADGDSGFSLNYKNGKKLLASLTGQPDLPFVRNDVPVLITGKYNQKVVTDLKVKIGNDDFNGTMNNGTLSLNGKLVDLDQILDPNWFAKFEDNQYLVNDPMLAPFNFGINLTISADSIKMNDTVYQGFIYSLDGTNQQMSISDSENGNLLFSISKEGSKYKYLVQLREFFVANSLFDEKSPINLSNTTITAQAQLESYGLTAYDIRRNMTGFVDASFDGGMLYGLGTDDFYNGVFSYGKMDTETALQNAMSGGQTQIKGLELQGEYSGGDFKTTKPFLLTARHTDITGNLAIKNNVASIHANIVLRGTSPIPKPVELMIDEKGRSYSLTEMLQDIDMDYLREFVSTHKKF